jgi:hypothetical protein
MRIPHPLPLSRVERGEFEVKCAPHIYTMRDGWLGAWNDYFVSISFPLLVRRSV